MIGFSPTTTTGYAQSRGESAYPDLWKGLLYGWHPNLVRRQSTIRGHGSGQGRNRPLVLSNGGPYGGNDGWASGPHGVGYAPTFNGTSHFAQAATINPGTNKISVVVWWYFNAFTNGDGYVLEHTAQYFTNNGFAFSPDDSGGSMFAGVGGTTDAEGRYYTRPAAATWHCSVILFDRTDATGIAAFYNDGLTLTSGSTYNGGDAGITGSNFASSTLNFFSRNGASAFGAGRLGPCFIYNRPLSKEEAVAFYSGASPLVKRRLPCAKYAEDAAPPTTNRRRRVIMSRAG